MHDVIVIGAGPSGLNATAKLKSQGLDVLVLEKKTEIGKPVVCTGIVGQQVFEEFDLTEESVLTKIDKVQLTSPYNSTLSYEHPFAFAYVVDREKFDKHLSGKIQATNGEVKLDTEVLDVTVETSGVKVVAKRGKHAESFKARMVLIATGINYGLHKKLGLGYPTDFLNGVQAELDLDNGDCTKVFIGQDVAPGAFAWQVPVGKGRVRIGLMTEKEPRSYFERLLKNNYPGIVKNLEREFIHYKAIAQGLVSKTYGERVLAVGEAAGQVKTTTGGGIYYGLLCSDIATQIIRESFEQGCFKAQALAAYEKRWRKAIQKEILTGYCARKLSAKFNDVQIEKLFQIVQNDGVFPLIKKEGNFDWHSDLILLLIKRIPLWQIVRSKIGPPCGVN
jgi:digeranylgeranylglycerophospholipid reductase